jgi:hypothetical protein
VVIDDVEVGDKSEDALLLLLFDLLGGEFLSGEKRVHCGYRGCNLEVDAGQVHILTLTEGDLGRAPVSESFGTDSDLVVNSGAEMLEFEETVIAGLDARLHVFGTGERGTFKSYGGSWNSVLIHIGDRTDDRSSLKFGCGGVLGHGCTGDRYTQKKETQAMPGTQLPSGLVHKLLVHFCHLCHSEKHQLKVSTVGCLAILDDDWIPESDVCVAALDSEYPVQCLHIQYDAFEASHSFASLSFVDERVLVMRGPVPLCVLRRWDFVESSLVLANSGPLLRFQHQMVCSYSISEEITLLEREWKMFSYVWQSRAFGSATGAVTECGSGVENKE